MLCRKRLNSTLMMFLNCNFMTRIREEKSIKKVNNQLIVSLNIFFNNTLSKLQNAYLIKN
jgi:hypothetical protein